jgi:hypothetical protein
MSTPEIEAERKRDSLRIGLAVAGVYFLVGAGYTFVEGRWFPGFPVQLDIAFLFGGHGTIGAYLEAGIAAVLGVLCIVSAIRKWPSDAS